jgi:hypothetical protein
MSHLEAPLQTATPISLANPKNDIQPISKDGLIGSIKKCHQPLWAGEMNPKHI